MIWFYVLQFFNVEIWVIHDYLSFHEINLIT